MVEKKVSVIEGGEIQKLDEKRNIIVVSPSSGIEIMPTKELVNQKKIILQDAGYNVISTSKVNPQDKTKMMYSFCASISLGNGYEKQIEFGTIVPC